ncbi:ABC transporter ATP-binding protein [Niallia taxi]|uniref:ABC transporter ATP-binding protein n=1 Tax=Niallia taxi TaxID=2499688 RepID=A0A3S2UHT4_9BACI|nr:ABC transporter ATP-binding protein [Niallia taxi]MDK8638853.1 ABC transporter ATP-binding protein [Niallia taxi]RVT67288.1 ABC transporter ATP-binding protein [Niallia taxi]
MGTLELKNVSMSYDTKKVLEQLNMTIHDGEFISILGPSGSGKSTIFHLIGGMLTPDEGAIFLNNKEITGKKGHISYMPQAPSLFPWRTVLENVLLIQEINGKKDKQLALDMLKKAGLADYAYAYPDDLSGGMKQRVSFVRALMSPMPLLCLDEPFGALDELTRLDMQKWLLSLWSMDKRTVLFITHNIEEALYLSDRIYILPSNPNDSLMEVTVPFPRPRADDLWLNEDFLEWKKDIYYKLKPSGMTAK